MNTTRIAAGLALSALTCFTNVLAQDEPNGFRLRQHQVSTQNSSDEDVRAEIEFGQIIAARVLGRIALQHNNDWTTYVNLIGRTLTLHANRPELDFHFAVLDADFINAYSAPGGYVFITRGAIAAMQDESELAAVLAHEIAHITEKHIVKEHNIRARDTSALSTVSSIVGGAQDSARLAVMQAVDKAVDMLLTTGPKHEDELAADETALLLLANTGYDPFALQRLLSRVSEMDAEAQTGGKVTHPPTRERIDRLAKLAQDNRMEHMRNYQGKERFQTHAQALPN